MNLDHFAAQVEAGRPLGQGDQALLLGECRRLARLAEVLAEEAGRLKGLLHGLLAECLNEFSDPYDDADESHVRAMRHCHDQVLRFAEQAPGWEAWGCYGPDEHSDKEGE